MSNSISEKTLLNGKKFFCINEREAKFLYDQMPNYITNGIKLQEEDTIFDVGANIGMFSLMCSDRCNNNINIYAFEPIPQIFQVLKLNVQRFNPNRIKLYNCGLSHSSKKQVPFTYQPKATGFSTMYPDKFKEMRDSIKSIILRNSDEASLYFSSIKRLPSFLHSYALNFELNALKKTEIVNCEVKTASQIIREQNIGRIDLLKIDVEKSELDVLLGIDKQDWSKIKQIVIEVHDLLSRVEKIRDLLSKKGFTKIIVEQEPLLRKSEYYNVYGLRN